MTSRSARELGRAPAGSPVVRVRRPGRPPACLDSCVPEFTAWRLALGLSRELFVRACVRRGATVTVDIVRGWERGVTTPRPDVRVVIGQMSGRGDVSHWFDLSMEETA